MNSFVLFHILAFLISSFSKVISLFLISFPPFWRFSFLSYFSYTFFKFFLSFSVCFSWFLSLFFLLTLFYPIHRCFYTLFFLSLFFLKIRCRVRVFFRKIVLGFSPSQSGPETLTSREEARTNYLCVRGPTNGFVISWTTAWTRASCS